MLSYYEKVKNTAPLKDAEKFKSIFFIGQRFKFNEYNEIKRSAWRRAELRL